VPEDYVHRIGRTGRAGAQGEAISLVCVDEDIFLRDIEKLIKRSIPREVVPGFEPPAGEKAEPIVLGRMTIGVGGTRRNAGGGGGGGHHGGRNTGRGSDRGGDRSSAPARNDGGRSDHRSPGGKPGQPGASRAPAGSHATHKPAHGGGHASPRPANGPSSSGQRPGSSGPRLLRKP